MGPQADKHELGSIRESFSGKSINLRTWMIFIIPGFLLVTSGCLYGLLLASEVFEQHGPMLALFRGLPWILTFSFLFILLGCFIIYSLLRSAQRLEIYENGIRYRSIFLRQYEYLWSEISGISTSSTRTTIFDQELHTIPSAILYFYQGKPLNITNRYQKIPRIIATTKARIYPLIWPRLKSTFRIKGRVEFGKIIVSRDKLYLKKLAIPWETINQLNVDSGYLIVNYDENSSQLFPISDIQNVELFLKFVDWGIRI